MARLNTSPAHRATPARSKIIPAGITRPEHVTGTRKVAPTPRPVLALRTRGKATYPTRRLAVMLAWIAKNPKVAAMTVGEPVACPDGAAD